MAIEAVIAIGVLAVVYLFVESEPATPASAASENRQPENYVASLKVLYTDINFWLLFAMFGLALGTFNTLATLLNELILPYNYTNVCSSIVKQ
jgi:hypothetical protein